MQLASRNPFSGQMVADEVFSCKTYWATPFAKALWLLPAPSQTFAALSRKCPYPQTRAIQGPWWLALAKPRQILTFGSLAAACGMCFRLWQSLSPLEGRQLPMKRRKVNVWSAVPQSELNWSQIEITRYPSAFCCGNPMQQRVVAL